MKVEGVRLTRADIPAAVGEVSYNTPEKLKRLDNSAKDVLMQDHPEQHYRLYNHYCNVNPFKKENSKNFYENAMGLDKNVHSDTKEKDSQTESLPGKCVIFCDKCHFVKGLSACITTIVFAANLR